MLLCLLLLPVTPPAAGQTPLASADGLPAALRPQTFEILGITVEGIGSEYTRSFVQQTSRLAVGQKITLPGDPALADAIRAIYRLGMFSDVKIKEERRFEQGVYLVIEVREVPKLADYSFSGIKGGDRKKLQKQAPLYKGTPVRPSAIERTVQLVKDFYAEKGYPLASVEVVRTVNPDNSLLLDFQVERGPRVGVGEVIIHGNEQLSDGDLLGSMKTKPKKWWQFWRKNTFKPDEFAEDPQRILEKYNEKGFYDARIVRDTTYLRMEGDDPKMVVELTVHEGPRYHIRNIVWEGNTVYPDAVLTEALGLERGDVYNAKRLEENLYGNKNSSDVMSRYMNRGYMRANVQPTVRVVEGDSLDLIFDVFEGEVYEFGTIEIAGNTKTKEHVIRRELITFPGETFSRDAIQESIRRLMQLNYFAQESLAKGPDIRIDEEAKEVDLTYHLEEAGSDQLELSGTWGRFGLVLQLRFSFNNFSAQNLFNGSAWKPLPSGDGQKLSLAVQTNGSFFQQYSLSFTEPWFRGRPTPVGFSASFSKITGSSLVSSTNTGKLLTSSVSAFYEKRLKWPDDFFSTSTTLGYQYFDNDNWLSSLPQGISQQVTIRQTLARNSTNHPIFPFTGSKLRLSLEIAPPVGRLIQYHKWRLDSSWNVPLSSKLSIGFGMDYGFIGSLTGEEVAFERFIVGGSPFETQGFYSFFGKEIIYMRAYPIGALGPRRNGDPFGGRILNKYAAELRWMAVQSQQLSAAPYLFVEAANTWDGFRSYNPSELFRSAGFGTRLFLPILGMVELVYGYNFDEFAPVNSRHDGSKKWTFQFTLGQGFNN
ncbi:outer membrane protein assembly factor BamA [Rhodocaloribacter litoris]|nr:outer membrane protein assembly factor BamA [Rhodocaloribacter litoris]